MRVTGLVALMDHRPPRDSWHPPSQPPDSLRPRECPLLHDKTMIVTDKGSMLLVSLHRHYRKIPCNSWGKNRVMTSVSQSHREAGPHGLVHLLALS